MGITSHGQTRVIAAAEPSWLLSQFTTRLFHGDFGKFAGSHGDTSTTSPMYHAETDLELCSVASTSDHHARKSIFGCHTKRVSRMKRDIGMRYSALRISG